MVTRTPADVATKPMAVVELQDKISLVNAHILARKTMWADMSENFFHFQLPCVRRHSFVRSGSEGARWDRAP